MRLVPPPKASRWLLCPLVYFVFAVAVTWPWAVKPSTTLIGPLGGDVSSSIAKFGSIARSEVVPFFSGRITSVGFPDGVPTTPGLDAVSLFSSLYLWLGSAVLGPVAAHGLLAVLGFFLTATVTFLFVRKVTGSTGAGFVAGLAYGFSPHLYAVAWAATTYAHMWLFVLPLWAFWNLALAPGRRAALLAGASLVPAMFWTPYYALHVSAVGAACIVVVDALAPRIGLERRLLLLAAGPWAVAAGLALAIGAATSFSDAPDRPLADFYEQAAHPLMFLWPGYSSIWGEGVSGALADLVPRARYTNLYVGLSVLWLAGIGAVAALGGWVSRRRRDRPSPEAIAALLALATVLVCVICSLPPWMLGETVPTPSRLIYELTPGLRAGQRFVMPLMAGTSVLAGLGVAFVLRGLSRAAVVPVTLAIALVVGVDLYTRPPGMNRQTPARTAAIEALADAPNGPVIHITREGWLAGQAQRACLVQEMHEQPLVNICKFATTPAKLQSLGQLPICETVATLRAMGLRYVLVEPLPAPRNVLACFGRASPVGSSRVLARDDHAIVVELPPSRSRDRRVPPEGEGIGGRPAGSRARAGADER